MEVTALNEHPEKVCHHKVVVYSGNQSAPWLEKKTIKVKKKKKRQRHSPNLSVMPTALPHYSRGCCGRSAAAGTTSRSSV